MTTNGRAPWWIVVVTMTAACTGDPVPQLTPDPSHALLTRSEAASAADCPAGGSILSTGLDLDDNGVLDDGEAGRPTVLCNPPTETPPPVPPTLVRIVAEPAGANCAQGGTAVQTGLDGNGNGQLDDAEVLRSDYVCGGAELLTRLVPEPEGAHCTAGGLALLIGRDLDGDHQLADSEVERTEYECGDILSHSVAIHSQAEADTIAHIRVIAGTLEISDPLAGPDGSLEQLVLPGLEEVRGALAITNVKATTRIRLPALQLVGGLTQITDNGSLTAIELPVLTQLGGGVDISRNPELRTLSWVMPVVNGKLSIEDNTQLGAITMPTNVVGQIQISGNLALAHLQVFVTAQTGALRILNNGGDYVNIDAFPTPGGGDAGRLPSIVQIADNPSVSFIGVHGNTAGSVAITGNATLDTVELDVFRFSGDVKIQDNPRVDQVAFDGFLVEIDGSLTLSGPISTLFVFPRVQLEVGGDMTLDHTQLTRLDAALRVAGTLHMFLNQQLTGTDQPWFAGGLDLFHNDALESLAMFQQRTFPLDVRLFACLKLASLASIENAEELGGNLFLDVVPLVPTLHLRATRIAGDVRIQNANALVDFSATALTSAKSVSIRSDPLLPALAFPALTSAPKVLVDFNDELTHLALPLLTQTTSIAVNHNHQLPTCGVLALFAGITAPSKQQIDNDPTASCAP